MVSLRIALAVACLLRFCDEAGAGAWTRAPEETFTAQSVRYFTTELSGSGNPPFRRVSTDTYIEHGLHEAITIGGELTFGQRLNGVQEALASGFVRARLWTGESGDVISAEFGGGYPILDAVTPLDATRDVTADLRAKISYGRGYAAQFGSGWFDAALTYRRRFGPPADEIKLDLTAGARPSEDWVLLAQMFGTLGVGNNGFAGSDFDVVKLSGSVGYRITEKRTLLLVFTKDAFGRNIDLGAEAALTLWTLF